MVRNYGRMRKLTDSRSVKYQDMSKKGDRISGHVYYLIKSLASVIDNIPENIKAKYIKSTPGLEFYKEYLMNLSHQQAQRLLQKKESPILSELYLFDSPRIIYNLLTANEILFPNITDETDRQIPISNSLFYVYIFSPNREVRKANEKAFLGTYKQFRRTIAALINSHIENNIFISKQKGKGSYFQQRMDEAGISPKVYKQMIETVNKNMKPLHHYISLRKRILNVEKLYGYDLANSLFPKANKSIPYHKAKYYIYHSLFPLGETYQEGLSEALNSRWIDLYENVGKCNNSMTKDIPALHPFIITNYYDQLKDVFTLVHELGHALHFHIARNKYSVFYEEYEPFCMEMASTVNEVLLMDHLYMKNSKKLERMYYLDFYLTFLRVGYYKIVLLAEFELKLYQLAANGNILTADLIEDTYGRLLKKYYGPDFTLNQYTASGWSVSQQLFHDFYNYSYATGCAGGVAISKMIKDGGEEAANKYVNEYLMAGTRSGALDRLKNMGIDFESPEPYLAVTQLFEKLLNELETLIEENEAVKDNSENATTKNTIEPVSTKLNINDQGGIDNCGKLGDKLETFLKCLGEPDKIEEVPYSDFSRHFAYNYFKYGLTIGYEKGLLSFLSTIKVWTINIEFTPEALKNITILNEDVEGEQLSPETVIRLFGQPYDNEEEENEFKNNKNNELYIMRYAVNKYWYAFIMEYGIVSNLRITNL